jgi:hypothetical protein
MTKFDYMVVQNAFQASDSNEFPLDDENLKEVNCLSLYFSFSQC